MVRRRAWACVLQGSLAREGVRAGGRTGVHLGSEPGWEQSGKGPWKVREDEGAQKGAGSILQKRELFVRSVACHGSSEIKHFGGAGWSVIKHFSLTRAGGGICTPMAGPAGRFAANQGQGSRGRGGYRTAA